MTKYQNNGSLNLANKFYELSINPIYSIFNNKKFDEDKSITTLKNMPVDSLKFLDTTSLTSNKMYSRINIIPRKKRYNIILYFFESFSYEYLNKKINDKYITPVWHRLAKNSLVAKRHYANFPLSANAMLSVMTSTYDSPGMELTIEKNPDIKRRTISEILSEHGYRTSLIHTGGLDYVGQRKFLKSRKFDKILEYRDLVKLSSYKKIVGWGIDERAMIKPSIDIMKEEPGRPFLMVYLPVNPHHPYAIPDNSFNITENAPASENRKGKWLEYLNSLYYSDQVLGMLVDELEKQKLTDDTLLFLFADHGEAFYQHRENYSHRRFIYEENAHVPFLIYNRQIFKTPYEYNGISRHIDILPTILDILNIDPKSDLEGISILSAHKEQLAFLHTNWYDDYLGVRDNKWKYIKRQSDGYEELYDLENDPLERSNISKQKNEITDIYRTYSAKAKVYKIMFYKKILQ